jgi:hypothetical protein
LAVVFIALVTTIIHRLSTGNYAFIFLFADREEVARQIAEGTPREYFTSAFIVSVIFSCAPCLAFAVVTEIGKFRHPAVYAVCGLLLVCLGLQLLPNADKALAKFVYAVSGICAGLIYWFLAGRHSGLWRKPAT